MDLYLLLLPLLLLLALTKLVFMKYAFAESIALSCFKKKPSKIIETEANASEVPAQMPSSDPKDVSSSESFCLAFKPTLLYFVQNMTLIELCMTRRPKNKISSLLAVSIIATLCILAQSPVYYCFLGAIISFLYFSV